MGRFAQECQTNGAPRARKVKLGRFAQEQFQQCWRFAQEWSEKSLIEGGMGIRATKRDHTCPKRPNVTTLARSAQ